MKYTDQSDFSSSSSPEVSPAPLALSAGRERRDPYLALRSRDFRLLFFATFLTAIDQQMMSVAIGWELYQRTNSPLALGLVGLVQVLPVIALALPAGQIADRSDRKRILLYSQGVAILAALGLTVLSFLQGPLILIYGCLLLTGISTAFRNPVSSALVAQTVAKEAYESAANWQSGSWQLASVAGPALGGLVIALTRSATPVFAFNTLTLSVIIFCVAALHVAHMDIQRRDPATLRSLLEGLNFLRRTQVMLAAITLDLFAVLLGGAIALLPIYARDILHVGPTGLGWLQAAPSLGAVSMTFCLANLPPFKRAGRTLLIAVTIFGVATCVFGLSHNFWLSICMLVLLGAVDNISVVIRSTLFLVRTPEEMRGRVSSVSGLFIAMSNQLGGFESGVTAQLLGPIAAVTVGGVGTVVVVILIATFWPEMRRLTTLSESASQ